VSDSDSDASLRTLAHPVRRRILQLIWDIELPSGDVAQGCGITKPAASQHLKALLNADLVTVRMRGPKHLYRARLDKLVELRELLETFWGEHFGALRGPVEDRSPGETGARAEP
jgi:DNA-binding transcriptional ArsR family regulator